MSPQIDIDCEVLDLLKQHAEPFVDTPNGVLRRLLGLGPSLQEDSVPAAGSVAASAPQNGRKRKSRRAGPRKSRAPRGTLLPEAEYELPILEALSTQPQGRAPAREVIEMIEPAIRDKLTELDRESINSGDMRWHNRAHFVRLHLVKMGQLAADAPRGLWEITDNGRERVNRERE